MITIILIIISSIFNSIMDTLQHHYYDSIFYKWRSNHFMFYMTNTESWRNKWKNGNKKNGEKFIGSSTIFAWLTDLWHFSKSIHLLTLLFAIVLYERFEILLDVNIILEYIIVVFSLKIIYAGVFQLFYEYILTIKK